MAASKQKKVFLSELKASSFILLVWYVANQGCSDEQLPSNIFQ